GAGRPARGLLHSAGLRALGGVHADRNAAPERAPGVTPLPPHLFLSWLPRGDPPPGVLRRPPHRPAGAHGVRADPLRPLHHAAADAAGRALSGRGQRGHSEEKPVTANHFSSLPAMMKTMGATHSSGSWSCVSMSAFPEGVAGNPAVLRFIGTTWPPSSTMHLKTPRNRTSAFVPPLSSRRRAPAVE